MLEEKENKKKKENKVLIFLKNIDNRTWLIIALILIAFSLILLEIFIFTLNAKSYTWNNVMVYKPTSKHISIYIFAFLFALFGITILIYALLSIIYSLRSKYNWTWKTRNNFSRIIIYTPAIIMLTLTFFTTVALFLSLLVNSDYGFNNYSWIFIQTSIASATFFLLLSTITILPWINKKIFLVLEQKLYKK